MYYHRPVPVKKLSVALDANVAESAARVAANRGMSLSAWLNDAARKALKVEEGLAAVREVEREHGPFSEEAKGRARAEWERLFGPPRSED